MFRVIEGGYESDSFERLFESVELLERFALEFLPWRPLIEVEGKLHETMSCCVCVQAGKRQESLEEHRLSLAL